MLFLSTFRSVLLFLWLQLIVGVIGWGPYTHAGCGTLYYKKHTQLDNNNHIATTTTETKTGNFRLKGGYPKQQAMETSNTTILLEEIFVSANSFPGAFKYVRDWMHTLEYAAFQVELAASWNKSEQILQLVKNNTYLQWKSSIDFIQTDTVKAFSYGYLLHLLEDYIGHHAGGYLNPNHDHLLELDVDALFYLQHKNDPAPWFYDNYGLSVISSSPQVRKEILDFVSQASRLYADQIKKINGSAVVEEGLNPKRAEQCIHRFTRLLELEQYSLEVNALSYKAGMVRYDVCHAETFSAANKTLQISLTLIEQALDVLKGYIFPFNNIPKVKSDGVVLRAGKLTEVWVDHFFDRHRGTICGDPSSLIGAPKKKKL